MIDTKRVTGRRSLSLAGMEDILADVEALDGSSLRTAGNWSAGQIVEHVRKVVAFSIDGFPFTAPLFLRLAARSFRGRALRGRMRPGITLPARMQPLLPDPNISWEAAVAALRGEIERLRGGCRMTACSPIFGPLTHAQWEMLHCRHAEMHFGFIRGAPPPAPQGKP